MFLRSPLLAALALGCPGIAWGQPELLNLAIGDPARQHRALSVAVDTVLDTASGEAISAQRAAERLSDARLILIAEQHTAVEYHRVQLRVLQLLHESGRALMVGLEMFPADRQAVLDEWVSGGLTEAQFVEASDWYGVWGYNWGYYREILLFAREHGIPLVALNRPQGAGGPQGGANGALPQPDLSSDDHRTLIRAFFESDTPVHGDLTDEQREALFEAQCTVDAIMAYHAAQALEARPERALVVLAGTGHVVYGLGIARQIQRWHPDPAAIILPVEVEADEVEVRASAADFLWGIPESAFPAFPELGAVTVAGEAGPRVIHVEPNTPGAAGGLETGDVLTRLNGIPVAEGSALNRALSAVRWGDEVSVDVRRDAEDIALLVHFRRQHDRR